MVFPFGRGGIIGGTDAGLGRALGESIVVAMSSSADLHDLTSTSCRPAANSIGARRSRTASANRRRRYGVPALMAAGLVLFLITLLVNTLALVESCAARAPAPGVEI